MCQSAVWRKRTQGAVYPGALPGRVQLARRLHQVAPPVVREDVMGGAGLAGRAVAPKARAFDQLQEVGVLAEAEQAGQHGIHAEQSGRPQRVPALRERQHERQAQIVMAERVAQVEPGLAAVGTHQLATEDAGHEDDGGRVRILALPPDQTGIDSRSRSQRADDHGPRHASQQAGEERQEDPITAHVGLGTHLARL